MLSPLCPELNTFYHYTLNLNTIIFELFEIIYTNEMKAKFEILQKQ